jgi:hypothetical protein
MADTVRRGQAGAISTCGVSGECLPVWSGHWVLGGTLKGSGRDPPSSCRHTRGEEGPYLAAVPRSLFGTAAASVVSRVTAAGTPSATAQQGRTVFDGPLVRSTRGRRGRDDGFP